MTESQLNKPKMESGSITKSVSVDVEVVLTSDLHRFSSGTIHCGFELATFQDAYLDDSPNRYKGSVVGGGETIGICLTDETGQSRSWGIPVSAIVEAALKADIAYLRGIK